MTAATQTDEDTRLPSYSEALEWGVIPPPRPQWSPPRVQSNNNGSRLTRLRPRPFSMGNIDATLANASEGRPQSAAGRPLSILDLSLDAVLRGDTPRADLRRSPISPTRPASSQSFRHSLTLSRPLSPHAFMRPTSAAGFATSPIREEEAAAAEGVPAAIPIHARPAVPPTYERHDPIARTYLLRTPLIYSSTGSSPQTPAYQLDAQLTKAGRPYQLRIRPLDHIESRTLSLRGDRRSAAGAGGGEVGYDDDHTLYLLQVMQLLGGLGMPGLGFGPSWRVEMQRGPKGGSSRNLSFIRFEGGGILGSGGSFMQRSCKFWYMTKKTDRELKGAHEWKLMNKYGYSPEYDWNKRLMFTVKRKVALGKNKGFEWKDGKGRLVAVESAEGRLDLTGIAAGMSAQSREALLACWVGKAWAAGALIW